MLLEQVDEAGMVQLPVKRARKPYRLAHLKAEALIAVRLSEVQPVNVEPVPS